jgi:hypothetical protein
MITGKTIIDAGMEGDLDKLEKAFFRCPDKEKSLFLWHVQRAFKEAVRMQHLFIIEHIVEELGMSIDHEAFVGYFHLFI